MVKFKPQQPRQQPVRQQETNPYIRQWNHEGNVLDSMSEFTSIFSSACDEVSSQLI